MPANIKKRKSAVKDTVYMAFFIVVCCICSWITIPFPIPFTMQTFAVFLILFYMGWKKGTVCITVYLIMGAAGMPVFSGGRGGIGVLAGSTGGYISGFIVAGLVYGVVTTAAGNNALSEIAAAVSGLFACYLSGTAWYTYVYMSVHEDISFAAVASMCVVPFIVPDILKILLAFALAKRLRRIPQ